MRNMRQQQQQRTLVVDEMNVVAADPAGRGLARGVLRRGARHGLGLALGVLRVLDRAGPVRGCLRAHAMTAQD